MQIQITEATLYEKIGRLTMMVEGVVAHANELQAALDQPTVPDDTAADEPTQIDAREPASLRPVPPDDVPECPMSGTYGDADYCDCAAHGGG